MIQKGVKKNGILQNFNLYPYNIIQKKYTVFKRMLQNRIRIVFEPIIIFRKVYSDYQNGTK